MWAVEFEREVRAWLQSWPGRTDVNATLNSICSGSCKVFFETRGCGIIPRWRNLSIQIDGVDRNPCSGDWTGTLRSRPLGPMCPVTCGCLDGSAGADVHCPGTCTR